MARNHLTLLGILLIPATTGCLYTDPVNVAPTVMIIAPTIERDTPLDFTAEVHDDDDPPRVTYQWGVVDGVCPGGEALPDGAFFDGTNANYTVTKHALGSYCVFVQVKDPQGATAQATMSFSIDDRQPKAAITLVKVTTRAFMESLAPNTFPRYSLLQFTATASSDPDLGTKLTPQWNFKAPDMTPGTPAPCASAPLDACFSVDQTGTYTLFLTVDDGEHKPTSTAGTSIQIIVADDQAPCIVGTEPDFGGTVIWDPAMLLTFRVGDVADDGDPLPALNGQQSMAWFSWAWRKDPTADFTQMVDMNLPTFAFPAGSFSSGQTVEVRVQAHDRRSSEPELDACLEKPTQPPACVVRDGCDQWVTWTVQYR